MAVTNEKSTERTNETASIPTLNPVDKSAKLHAKYFSFTQGAAAGDIGSTQELCKLPAGNVRVLKHLSVVVCSAFGASRTLDVGSQAYTSSLDGSAVAASADTLLDGADVSALASKAFGVGTNALTADASKLYQSKDGVVIQSVVAGGTIPAAATLTGVVVYMSN